GFETIHRLLDQAEPAAGGPHPLLGDLVWTVLPATAAHPARLSLHRRKVLPVEPSHPHLDGQLDRLPLPIPEEGAISVGSWQLTSSLGPPSMLPPTWRSRSDPWRAFLDADQARDLVLATTRPGLQIAPLGLEGRRRAVGDLFTDHKTPPALRPVWPLVLDRASGEALWVCGLAVSHTARITPQTRCVRALAWQPLGSREQTPMSQAG
ncbi:MAG TPA: tRNA lysidine(34) synthetase TilS, partial [Caldilineaceae bacterium]|nr:tRNA lysidine(34) synthetase TilS [Caldilineaceae bacterium]